MVRPWRDAISIPVFVERPFRNHNHICIVPVEVGMGNIVLGEAVLSKVSDNQIGRFMVGLTICTS